MSLSVRTISNILNAFLCRQGYVGLAFDLGENRHLVAKLIQQDVH